MNAPLDGMRALVTGAGGFIGSHLTEALLAGGARVRAFVRYTSSGKAGWLEDAPEALRDRLELRFGDLRDPSAVDAAVADCTHVFHLGAVIAIPYSYQNPREFTDVNVGGTQNVLEAVRRCGTRRAVFTSTSEVYGSARSVPMDEEHARFGQSPYAASKIGADALVTSYHCSFALPAVIARPFNTYGPRQSLRAVVPAIIAQAQRGGALRLGALTPTRDLNFVGDTVAGLIACGTAPDVEGQVFNLGSGREISIGDLAAKVCEMLGVQCKIETDERRLRPQASEVVRLCADSRRARELLGWTPKVPLEEGLKRTALWLKQSDPVRWVSELQL
jgi:NAD dependent epimerase/dehydratase